MSPIKMRTSTATIHQVLYNVMMILLFTTVNKMATQSTADPRSTGCIEYSELKEMLMTFTTCCQACEDKQSNRQDGLTNLALHRPAFQSSTYPGSSAARAVDGNADPDYGHNHCSSTNDPPGGPNWLVVDLGDSFLVNFVVLTNRNECCTDYLNNFIVGLTDSFNETTNPPVRGTYTLCGQYPSAAPAAARLTQWCNYPRVPSRYVIIQQPAAPYGYLAICELEVYGEKAWP